MGTRRVKIHREKPTPPIRLPITESAHNAGVVGDVPVAALRARRHVPAERLRPAGLDRRHHLELGQADMPGMGPPPRGTMGTEDVGDLQLRPDHPGPGATPGRA